jgi:MFS transporter, SP family, xylose:H+ symportor
MSMSKRLLLRSSLVAALGGLLFGFDTAVISGAEEALRSIYELSDFWYGFTVASALIGTIVGSIGIGRPSDWVGRKKTLIAIALFYFVSAVGSALAWSWYSFLAFRFLGGLAVGGATVVSPTYIAEISPARLRGRLVAVTQFNIVFGILLAFFSNYLITRLQLGAVEWRWMFGVEALPAAAFFFLLFANPDSPRWLVAKRRIDEASVVLGRLGTDAGGAEEELAAIRASLDLEHEGLRERFFCRKYAQPILLAVLIAVFNQLSGINAILYYAPGIFRMAGAATQSAMLQSVIIGLTNLVFTMAALAIIDHFGRKRLMLAGSIGYILSLSAASIAFFRYGTEFTPAGGKVVLIALIVFIAAHAFGQGAVIWVFISEIFPNRVRARGQALGSFTHWFMAAAVSWTFKPIAGRLGGGPVFAIYAVMMVLQLLWVIFRMPETKGIPLEQIEERLGIESPGHRGPLTVRPGKLGEVPGALDHTA